MCEVVYWVDWLGVVGVLVFDVFDLVQCWVVQVDVVVGYVDFGLYGVCIVWEFVGVYVCEQVQVFFYVVFVEW